jgi:hypothetical protein
MIDTPNIPSLVDDTTPLAAPTALAQAAQAAQAALTAEAWTALLLAVKALGRLLLLGTRNLMEFYRLYTSEGRKLLTRHRRRRGR